MDVVYTPFNFRCFFAVNHFESDPDNLVLVETGWKTTSNSRSHSGEPNNVGILLHSAVSACLVWKPLVLWAYSKHLTATVLFNLRFVWLNHELAYNVVAADGLWIAISKSDNRVVWSSKGTRQVFENSKPLTFVNVHDDLEDANVFLPQPPP